MKTILLAAIITLISSVTFGDSFSQDLVIAAIDRTKHRVTYDGSYFSIPYPNGDIPENLGVCTDVIIRSYRKIGSDLQKEVHEDMAANFNVYPSKKIWGLSGPDKHIDHRRVPNLQVFFSRHGEVYRISNDPAEYKPGDLVTWRLPGNLPHIGIVTDRLSQDGKRPLVVHNVGAGPELADFLFVCEITGHYRYLPAKYRMRTGIQPQNAP